MTTKQIGDMGEEAAANYLKRQGLKILCRQYRTAQGEIDIIAADSDMTVFAEVKTRRYDSWGRPGEFVGRTKQKRLLRAALEYMGESEMSARFDVIEVMYELSRGMVLIKEISWIKNAFEAGEI